jgi:hypothetical protein
MCMFFVTPQKVSLQGYNEHMECSHRDHAITVNRCIGINKRISPQTEEPLSNNGWDETRYRYL